MSKLKTNLFTKKILLACAVTAVLVVCLTVVSTRSSVSGASINPTGPVAPQGGILDVLARQRLAIVGAWNVPDPEGISSLYTFNADGTMSESDVDHTFTAGHGIWYHLGGTQFAYTFIQYKKDDQDQVGSVTVYGTLNLDRSGNSFTGPLHFEFKDTTGKVDTDASLGLEITTNGTRIQIRQ